jgi:hypothetical protein
MILGKERDQEIPLIRSSVATSDNTVASKLTIIPAIVKPHQDERGVSYSKVSVLPEPKTS